MSTARILIVEDDAILVTHLEQMLIQSGYQVSGLAATGEAAVESALAQKPDAIVMDIRLRGEMTGIQAAVEIHRQIDTPIIYLTAYADEEMLQQAKITGAYAYLAKPVRERELRASLEMALYKHAAERRVYHLNQVLRAVRDINQLITHQHDRRQLLAEACQILVRARGYRLAWIGLPDGSGLIPPVAFAGKGWSFIDQIGATPDKALLKRLPGMECLVTKQAVTCHDMLRDERYAPWHAEAEAVQFHSTVAIPMLHDARVFGVLNVYADQSNLFDAEEVELLVELANDLAFSLKVMEEAAERNRTEEARRESETRFQQMADLLPQVVFECDLQGQITYGNQYALDLFGYQRFEPGLNIFEFVDESQHERTLSMIQMLINGQDDFDHEYLVRRKDGSLFPVLFYSSVIRKENQPWGLRGVVIDVSEVKRSELALRDSEARYRFIAENTPDVIWVLSLTTGKFTYISPSVQQLRGYTPEEVLTQTMADVVTPESLAKTAGLLQRRLAAFQAGDASLLVIIDEVDQLRKDGTVVSTEVVTKLVVNAQGQPIEIVGVSRDITERLRSEEDRIARKIAERANRAKSEFLSRMSHELRTPLNAILGFAQLLKMDELRPNQERGVDQIYKSGRHLLNLVNEVLDIARIEAGRMRISLEPVRLEDAVQETLELIRLLAEARHLSLSFESPSSSDVFVQADRQGFRQVLLNLFSNAVKYNREGGEIAVTASLTIDGRLRLQVRDTGAGIPPDKMERLFVPFERLGMESVEQEGVGLGLALSKGLVEAMGGRIGVESKPGEGSMFWLELQLGAERLKEVIIAEVDGNLSDRMRCVGGRVLYVEDSLANVKLVEAIMERLPQVKLITAMQGRLAMDLAKEHQPDLILLDLQLPDIHGSDVLRWLNAEPATQKIPIIILSANAMPEQIADLLAQGARTYLTKPINVKEFLKVVEEFLGEPDVSARKPKSRK